MKQKGVKIKDFEIKSNFSGKNLKSLPVVRFQPDHIGKRTSVIFSTSLKNMRYFKLALSS